MMYPIQELLSESLASALGPVALVVDNARAVMFQETATFRSHQQEQLRKKKARRKSMPTMAMSTMDEHDDTIASSTVGCCTNSKPRKNRWDSIPHMMKSNSFHNHDEQDNPSLFELQGRPVFAQYDADVRCAMDMIEQKGAPHSCAHRKDSLSLMGSSKSKFSRMVPRRGSMDSNIRVIKAAIKGVGGDDNVSNISIVHSSCLPMRVPVRQTSNNGIKDSPSELNSNHFDGTTSLTGHQSDLVTHRATTRTSTISTSSLPRAPVRQPSDPRVSLSIKNKAAQVIDKALDDFEDSIDEEEDDRDIEVAPFNDGLRGSRGTAVVIYE